MPAQRFLRFEGRPSLDSDSALGTRAMACITALAGTSTCTPGTAAALLGTRLDARAGALVTAVAARTIVLIAHGFVSEFAHGAGVQCL